MIAGGRGPTKVTTGVRVINADDTSWSYMTPEGHPWAAIITFSAYEEDGVTVARIHLLVRANGPLYEASFRIYTGRLEDKIWTPPSPSSLPISADRSMSRFRWS